MEASDGQTKGVVSLKKIMDPFPFLAATLLTLSL